MNRYTDHEYDWNGPPEPDDYDPIEDAAPTDKCLDCGKEIWNPHYACQGHQFCLPECPTCGGELALIEEVIPDETQR